MKKFKSAVQEYFSISEREANGFVIFLFFMLFVLLFPWAYRYFLDRTTPTPSVSISTFDIDDLHQQAAVFYDSTVHPSLVKFDPNTADSALFQTLGIDKKITRRIIKYRAAGGSFKVKTDLKKIYGFPEDLYSKLQPYILLPDSSAISADHKEKKVKSFTSVKTDLNKLSAAEFEKFRGIGPVLSVRILKFRDGLGGFVSTDQLREVFGLDSTVASEIIARTMVSSNFIPAQIDINSADVEGLDKHPYIDKKTAWAIYRFRQKQGKITDVSVLVNEKIITEEKSVKLAPYLKF